MDTTLFIDSVKIIDTVRILYPLSLYDTLTFKTISNNSSLLENLFDIIKLFVPIFLGSYMAFRFALRKDKQAERKRIKRLREFLILSLELLKTGVKEQMRILRTFNDQYTSGNTLEINPNVYPEFQVDNLESLSKIDLHRIFIYKLKLDWDEKVFIYSNYNFVVRAVNLHLKNIEKIMLETIRESIRLENEINGTMNQILDLIITYNNAENPSQGSLAFCEYVEKITNDFNLKYKDKEDKQFKSLEIKYNEVYRPLFSKSLELKVSDASLILNKTINTYRVYNDTITKYSHFFNKTITDLQTVEERLSKVINALLESKDNKAKS